MSSSNQALCLRERTRILREIQSGNLQAAKDLKAHHPNLHWSELRHDKTGETILHIASRLGFTEIVDYLLTNYEPTAVDCTNRDNKTPLHEAAQFAQHGTLDLLLKHHASVNALKRADWTPLMLACTKLKTDGESFNCVELLLRKGALVNCENKDGWTALHLVSREGCPKILYLLLEYGLDAFKVTKNGRSALHVSALHGHLNIVKALVNLGLDVNLRDSCGNTVLHEAVLGGNKEVCGFLLSGRGNADLSAVNGLGFGVMHLAASVGRVDMIEYLSKLGVDVDLPSKVNLTPLHCAARKKQGGAVQALVSLGANAYFRDNFGRCAVEYMNF